MDEHKEKALIGWVMGLTDMDPSQSLSTIDYGACFINILQYMDSTATLEEFPTTKERVHATQKFLEDFYNTSFANGQLANFSILSETVAQHGFEEQVAKVLLLLLCAGIQDKNSEILSAAMHVDAALHWDIRQLIESVVRPDELTTSLPTDFAKVLLEHSVFGSSSVPSV
ncbi:uncharacterized protein [Littorina saxatilis]|uniref:uncharacterized protein n=1 Tax=Littorina saxatilis TaxID=31220 RepID=UPI0038B482C4